LNAVVFVTNRETSRRLDRLEALCRTVATAHNLLPVFFERVSNSTVSEDRASALERCVAATGAELVVAMGGDGTVHVCAQAIHDGGTALAIVPRGAANLVAHSLQLPFALEDALAVGFGDHERAIDLAVVNGRISLAMAGIGADAAVIEATPGLLKRHLGWFGYAVAALSQLHTAPHDFEIRLDGGAVMRRTAHAVVVGNVGTLPGGFALLPGARLDDGLLDVGVLAPEGVWGWARLGGHLLEEHAHAEVGSARSHWVRAHPRSEDGVEHLQARYIEITAEAELACQVDGEVIGRHRTLEINVRDHALKVRVPA
jgi:diacylglycerol kinase family enzyme